MKARELNRQFQQIKRLINSTTESTGDNIELQGHWGKYLCVLAAGFLENAISHIYIEFTSNSSSPQVSSFARNTLGKISNPKSSKFVEVAYSFNKEWGKQLEDYFESNPGIKDAIDSIMANRHQIAHGKSTSISVIRVNNYLKDSVKVLEFIEEQCDL